MKIYLVCIFGALWSTADLAAQDCLANLEEGTRAYYNGRFSDVVDLLAGCDYSGLDTEEKADVLELLIKANLFLENSLEADQYMSELLESNPLYQPRSSDILLFRELFASYDLVNYWNFGVVAGYNIPRFEIMRYQSIGSVTSEPVAYTGSNGLSIGVSGERQLFKNLYFNMGILYQDFNYSYSELILGYQQLDVSETMHTLNIPVALRYEVELMGLKLFVLGGLTAHTMLKSSLDLDLRAVPTDIPIPYVGIPFKTSEFNSTFQHRKYSYNYLFGGGVRKTYNTFQFELAVNYEFGLNNLIRPDERLANPLLIERYAYVPDDFKLDHFRITLGVYKSLLSPIKK